MGAIYKREFTSFFNSPIGYVFLAVFLLFSGYFFYAGTLMIGTTDLSAIFSNMSVIMMFLFPILTMKLLSEDKKQKTDQCLLTSPVSLSGIVFGKYLAALSVFGIGMCIYFVYALVVAANAKTIPWMVFFGNMLGMFLVGAAFISIGLFISCLTENQVIAAIGSFAIMMVFNLMEMIASFVKVEFLQNILNELAFFTRYYEFTTGILNIANILFFASFVVVFNFLTIRVLEKRRWS